MACFSPLNKVRNSGEEVHIYRIFVIGRQTLGWSSAALRKEARKSVEVIIKIIKITKVIFIYIVFHFLVGYDIHLCNLMKSEDLKCLSCKQFHSNRLIRIGNLGLDSAK